MRTVKSVNSKQTMEHQTGVSGLNPELSAPVPPQNEGNLHSTTPQSPRLRRRRNSNSNEQPAPSSPSKSGDHSCKIQSPTPAKDPKNQSASPDGELLQKAASPDGEQQSLTYKDLQLLIGAKVLAVPPCDACGRAPDACDCLRDGVRFTDEASFFRILKDLRAADEAARRNRPDKIAVTVVDLAGNKLLEKSFAVEKLKVMRKRTLLGEILNDGANKSVNDIPTMTGLIPYHNPFYKEIEVEKIPTVADVRSALHTALESYDQAFRAELDPLLKQFDDTELPQDFCSDEGAWGDQEFDQFWHFAVDKSLPVDGIQVAWADMYTCEGVLAGRVDVERGFEVAL